LFLSLSNYDFGVILSPSGQGSLSAETEFVGQRHTLPISRVDTIEVSTLSGCPLRGDHLHILYPPAKLRRISKYLIINDIHSFSFHFPAFPQGLEITKLLTYFAVDLGQNIPIYQLIYRPTKLS